jgi:hypothetical protein
MCDEFLPLKVSHILAVSTLGRRSAVYIQTILSMNSSYDLHGNEESDICGHPEEEIRLICP